MQVTAAIVKSESHDALEAHNFKLHTDMTLVTCFLCPDKRCLFKAMLKLKNKDGEQATTIQHVREGFHENVLLAGLLK